jgi:hypothetical protein
MGWGGVSGLGFSTSLCGAILSCGAVLRMVLSCAALCCAEQCVALRCAEQGVVLSCAEQGAALCCARCCAVRYRAMQCDAVQSCAVGGGAVPCVVWCTAVLYYVHGTCTAQDDAKGVCGVQSQDDGGSGLVIYTIRNEPRSVQA